MPDLITKLQDLHAHYGESMPVVRRYRFLFWTFPMTLCWLHIKFTDQVADVMTTSDQDTHCRAWGARAYNVDFGLRTGEPREVWASAISLWPVRDPDERVEIVEQMKNLIDLAHQELLRARR